MEIETACCSAFYEQNWVRELADDNFHPGGEELTRRTVAGMGLSQAAAVADLGCGTGTTALMLARETSFRVGGVDISASNIERAARRPGAETVALGFHQADTCSLPFANQELDGVLAECSLSLVRDQSVALGEIRRVLKPDGKLAVTDMAVEGRLPDDIARVSAPWTCLNGARDRKSWTRLLASAGFREQYFADESAGLAELIRRLKRQLLLGAGALLAANGAPVIDLAAAKHWLDRFQAEVDRGRIRYLRFNLQKDELPE
jgi:ubiquinone/menaquinone biosynthesis C-methylase UbiE